MRVSWVKQTDNALWGEKRQESEKLWRRKGGGSGKLAAGA